MSSPQSEFGDWVPEDSYSPPADDLSPLALARRLHEERNFLERLAGREPARWSELTDEDRDVAVELMVKIVAWLRLEGVIGKPRPPRGVTIVQPAQSVTSNSAGDSVVEPEKERRGLRGLADRLLGDDD